MTCKVDGCSKPVKALGMCSMHYKRYSLYGTTEGNGTPKGAPWEWFKAHTDYAQDDCLIWPFNRGGDGYARIMRARACKLVHRLMCEATHGAPPTPRHEAAHLCGQGSAGCVNPRHVRWALPAENQADRIIHGTSNRGEQHGMAKLTESDVRQIMAMKGAMTQKEIGLKFGVSRTAIKLIHQGKTWGWLDA